MNSHQHTAGSTTGSVKRSHFSRHRRVSLCETLDRVLNKGAVVTGDVIISVAEVDLISLNLNLILSSVETVRKWRNAAPVSAPVKIA